MSSRTLYRKSAATGGAMAGVVFLVVAAIVGLFLIAAWTTMLGLGILHQHLSPAIPALGLKDAAWTTLGLALVIGGRGGTKTIETIQKRRSA